jgi:thymidylate kinase
MCQLNEPYASARPLYVALEGLKGSGKSTLLATLAAHLESRGVEVILLCPTSPAPWWSWRELAARITPLKSSDVFMERLYAARSAHTARKAARAIHRASAPSQTARPVLFLGDRSFYTSLVTRWERAERLGEAAHWERTRALEPHIPLPDVVIYLDLPLDQILSRLRRRARDYGQRDETAERLIAARAAYERLISSAHNTPSKWVRLSGESLTLSQDACALLDQLTASAAYQPPHTQTP